MSTTPILSGLAALISLSPLIAQELPSGDPIKLQATDFVVKSSTARPIEVIQPSGVPGVPATKSTIQATVQMVQDPELPDPPVPSLPPDLNDPQTQARMAAFRQDHAASGMTLACLSATWYPREQVSKVFWQSNGKSYGCVSRRNFLHLSGQGGFFQGDHSYALVLGVGVEDTALIAEASGRNGRVYEPPVFPVIPAGQDYVITNGDAADTSGTQVIVDVHETFRTDAAKLEREWRAHEQAAEERKAELLANPPAAPDVTIRFWKRNRPVGQAAEEGGQP